MIRSKFFLVFLLIIVAYFVAVLIHPTDPATLERLQLSQLQANLVNVSVMTPITLIWIAAFYGSWTLHNYTKKIIDTPEGRGLDRLSKGLMVLAFSLPTLALVGALSTIIGRDSPENMALLRVIRHLLGIAFTLLAFVWISNGAEELSRRVRKRLNLLHEQKILAPFLIISSTLFGWLIVAIATRNHDPTSIYSMPQWFIVIGVVIPYLYSWYRGLTAVYYLHFYAKHVKGHVYRKAFSYISKGLAGVIVIAIVIQFITATSPQLQRLNFTPLLLVVYAFIATYAFVYGMIAAGARKLKKIEEV